MSGVLVASCVGRQGGFVKSSSLEVVRPSEWKVSDWSTTSNHPKDFNP